MDEDQIHQAFRESTARFFSAAGQVGVAEGNIGVSSHGTVQNAPRTPYNKNPAVSSGSQPRLTIPQLWEIDTEHRFDLGLRPCFFCSNRSGDPEKDWMVSTCFRSSD